MRDVSRVGTRSVANVHCAAEGNLQKTSREPNRESKGVGGGRVHPPGPGFGPGSVPVLVTILGLAQSHSVTVRTLEAVEFAGVAW